MSDEPRRRGRPALAEGEPSTPVNVRLPPKQYDEAYRKAQKDRESVPDVLRRALAKLLEEEGDD